MGDCGLHHGRRLLRWRDYSSLRGLRGFVRVCIGEDSFIRRVSYPKRLYLPEMSTIKSAPKGRALPPHPHYLVFERSDGDAAHWPKNTTRVVDDAGQPTPDPNKFCSATVAAWLRASWDAVELSVGNVTVTPVLLTACPAAMSAARDCAKE